MIKPSAERQMSHDLKKDRVEEVLIGCKDEKMEGETHLRDIVYISVMVRPIILYKQHSHNDNKEYVLTVSQTPGS